MTADAAFWNGLAEKYSKKPVENPDAFERKIAVTKSKMSPRDVVLDIGCGTGSLALRLAPSAGHVHGLDVSREMVRIANEKAQAGEVGNVTFHVGDIDAGLSTFEPATLDGVCAYSILHLLEDRQSTLRAIFELLKPGGFFVSSTVCLGETWIPYRPLLTVMRWLGKAPMVKIFSKSALVEDIEAAGFTDVAQPDVGAEPIIGFMVAQKPE